MKLHAALCLGLFATACDPGSPETDPMMADDIDDGAGEDEDDGLEVLDGDDDVDPEDGDADDGAVPQFDNDPKQAAQALDGMQFVCSVQDGVYYNVHFAQGGALYARDQDGYELSGTYAAENGTITMSFPGAGFVESSVAMEIEADTLATFTTPSLFCHAIALQDVAVYESENVQCPSIKYIPETSWEDNQFHFGNDGGVKRRRWRELVAANDTLYSEMFGVYVSIGDWVIMMFGDGPDGERLLIGQVTSEGLYIDELDPERGPCTTVL